VPRSSAEDACLACLVRWCALWMLGYPEAALADAEQALSDAREIGQAATLMYALFFTSLTLICSRNYATATTQSDELFALAEEKGALFWKAPGMMNQGSILALTGKPSDAVQKIAACMSAWRSSGATLLLTLYLSCLARAHANSANLMMLGAALAKR